MSFTITRAWIHENSTTRGAWTKAQLAVLGVKWPPQQGWLTLQEGRVISDQMKQEFEKWREPKDVPLEPISPEDAPFWHIYWK